MAIYEITTTKTLGAYSFTNGYRLIAASRADARRAVDAVINLERGIMPNFILITNVHIALEPDPGRTDFENIPYQIAGIRNVTQAANAGAVMELCLNIGTSGGLPGKKRYRFGLAKSDYTTQGEGYSLVDVNLVAAWQSLWTDFLETLDQESLPLVVGENERAITEAVTFYVGHSDPHKGWYNKKPTAK